MSTYFNIRAGRRKKYTPVPENIPGADSPTRTYIPGYADNQIIFLDTVSGNDANNGTTEALAKLTYGSAATAAGSDKKIRVINDGAVLSVNITKPTEMKLGGSGTIQGVENTIVNTIPAETWTEAFAGAGQVRSTRWYKGKMFLATQYSVLTSDDGVTFTVLLTISETIKWFRIENDRLFVLCFGAVYYTENGLNFNSVSIDTAEQVTTISYSQSLDRYIIGGNFPYFYITSDLINVSRSNIFNGVSATFSIFFNNLFIAFNFDGNYATSINGVDWLDIGTTAGGFQVNTGHINKANNLLVIGDNDGVVYSSVDGLTYVARTASAGSALFDSAYIPELSCSLFVSEGFTLFSFNGTAYSQPFSNALSATIFQGVDYSPSLSKVLYCSYAGGNSYFTTGPTYTVDVENTINGFNVFRSRIVASALNFCTGRQVSGTPTIINGCKFTESPEFKGNTVTVQSSLFEKNIEFNSTPATQNATQINRNTISGRLNVVNSSSTSFEQVQENIIEGGINASFRIFVESGNTRGTSNNVTFGALTTSTDPRFMPNSFVLQREGIGAVSDSPLVGASFLFTNSIGDPSDIGAYRYNDSTLAYFYERSMNLKKPSLNKGGNYSKRIKNRVTNLTSDDGTPDVLNDKGSRTEILSIEYNTVEADHFEFFEWLESNFEDMTVELSLLPDYTGATSVTTSGTQASGAYLLTLVSTTGLNAGQRISYGGQIYWITQIISITQIVLASPLRAEIPTATVMQIEGTEYDTYQYAPAERTKKNWLETDQNYFRGLTLEFLRKI